MSIIKIDPLKIWSNFGCGQGWTDTFEASIIRLRHPNIRLFDYPTTFWGRCQKIFCTLIWTLLTQTSKEDRAAAWTVPAASCAISFHTACFFLGQARDIKKFHQVNPGYHDGSHHNVIQGRTEVSMDLPLVTNGSFYRCRRGNNFVHNKCEFGQ